MAIISRKEEEVGGRVVKNIHLIDTPYLMGEKEEQAKTFQEVESLTIEKIKHEVEEDFYQKGYSTALKEINSRGDNLNHEKELAMENMSLKIAELKKDLFELMLCVKRIES